MRTLEPWIAITPKTHVGFDHAYLAMLIDSNVRFYAESTPYRVRNRRLEHAIGDKGLGWQECTLSRAELDKMTWHRLELARAP